MTVNRWFDDFALGEQFVLPPRRIAGSMIDGFEDATGGRAIQPGGGVDPFLVLAQVTAPHLAELVSPAMIGLLGQWSRFVRPAHEGESLLPVLQVVGLQPADHEGVLVLRSTIHNGARELLMEGEQQYRLRRRANPEPRAASIQESERG